LITRAISAMDQHVNVIGGAVDDEGGSAHFAEDAAEVGMEIGTKIRGDEGKSLFGGEDQMNNDIAAGLGHVSCALAGLGLG
jgi:hypothetical protein